jgi:hypothetical protein
MVCYEIDESRFVGVLGWVSFMSFGPHGIGAYLNGAAFGKTQRHNLKLVHTPYFMRLKVSNALPSGDHNDVRVCY